MVQEAFDSILQEIGAVLKIPNLHLDKANTCLIQFSNGLTVYFEPFEHGDFMLISSPIAEISPGRFRADVLREALKENDISGTASGIFAFKNKKQELTLFALLPLREINGEKVAAFLQPFLEKGANWKNTLAKGALPQTNASTISQGIPTGFFGLRP